MRLFIALEIPAETRQQLDESSRALRHELPSARWVRHELMHLTLVFLGETDRALLAELKAFIEAVREQREPTVTGQQGAAALEVALQITRRIHEDAEKYGIGKQVAKAAEAEFKAPT